MKPIFSILRIAAAISFASLSVHISHQNIHKMIVPVKVENLVKESYHKEVDVISRKFKIPRHLAQETVRISKLEKIDPYLIAALIWTESSYRHNAVSSKNYRGLMQIKYDIPWKDVNIQIGIKIFKEKYALANGDIHEAIILYKGYANDRERGIIQANKVIYLWNSLHAEEMKSNA